MGLARVGTGLRLLAESHGRCVHFAPLPKGLANGEDA